MLRTILVSKASKDRKQTTDWRSIIIGSAVQRLLHRVLISMVNANGNLNKNQRGFVQTDDCLANVFTLNSLINKRTSA